MIRIIFFKQILILLFIVIVTVNLIAQSSGVASKYSGLVNNFTGDFNYSIPLLNVPSPDGNGIPITIGYSAGIRVNQEASWVGLGWDLNPGEIRRKVNGVPDDWKAVSVTDKYSIATLPISSEMYSFYGPLYFKDFDESGSNKMDLYQSARGADEYQAPFEFPDYDEYYVSAPGFGGAMKPFLFDFANLYHQDDFDAGVYYGNNEGFVEFSKKAEFRFFNEPGGQIYVPLYGNMDYYTSIKGGTYDWYYKPVYDPNTNEIIEYTAVITDTRASADCFDKFKRPNQITDRNYYGNGVDPTTHKPDQQNFIEYFTNAEINNFNPAISTNNIKKRGFLDYRIITSGDRRSPSDFDADGIGAFKITSPEGITYHYSLPVYSSNEVVHDFKCNADWTPSEVEHQYEKNHKYASSWKLTAITGADYIDYNNNGIADTEDKGYWVAYDYELWCDNFNWRDPYLNNGNDEYYYNLEYKNNISYYSPTITVTKNYERKATYMTGSAQLYYLKAIKTSAYTAYFFKDIRKDGNSTVVGSSSYVPKLYLKYIILVDNSMPQLTSSLMSQGSDYPPLGLNYSILNINTYNFNSININNHTLKKIEFIYDYSLASGTYNNINYIKNMNDNNGKLTLKGITTFEKGGAIKLFSPYVFDYANNQAFNHEKQDFFGFYKSDYDQNAKAGYIISEEAQQNVNAWSLNKILTPEGVELNVEYESDSYIRETYETENPLIPGISRCFPIKNVTASNDNFVVELFDKDGVNLLSQSTILKTNNIYFNEIYHLDGLDFEGLYICSENGFNFSTVSDYQFEITGGLNTSASGFVSYYQPSNHAGYLAIDLLKAYGGGTRVKNIIVKDTKVNQQYGLEFEYDNGTLTTDPDIYGKELYVKHWLQASRHFSDRHALPSTVGYGTVTTKEIGVDGRYIGKVVNEYNVSAQKFEPIITLARYSVKQGDPLLVNGVPSYFSSTYFVTDFEVNELFLKDLWGMPKSVKIYDINNNIVSSKNIEYEFIGETNEAFFRPFSINDYINYTVFKKNYYTAVPKVITETIDNISTKTRINSRDFLTGIPTQTEITSSANNNILISKTPAYLSNSKLGLKCRDIDNLNILNANRKEIVYNSNQITNGTNTVWTETNMVRQYGSGVYATSSGTTLPIPTKTYSYNGVSDENNWLKTSEITLINPKNMMLELKNVNDVYSSVKYGYNEKFKIAEALNAKYTDIAFSGAEDNIDNNGYFGGEIKLGNGSINDIDVHTGTKSILTSNEQTAFIYEFNNSEFDINKSYRISVWAKEENTTAHEATIKVTYFNSSQSIIYSEEINTGNSGIKTFGDWYLLNFSTATVTDVPILSNAVKVVIETLNKPGGSTTCYFDDFRIKPEDASMSTYVYDEFTGNVIASHDNENISTTYEYDQAGRVTITKVETATGFKKASRNEYYQSLNQ